MIGLWLYNYLTYFIYLYRVRLNTKNKYQINNLKEICSQADLQFGNNPNPYKLSEVFFLSFKVYLSTHLELILNMSYPSTFISVVY